jgi:hypothetical protein
MVTIMGELTRAALICPSCNALHKGRSVAAAGNDGYGYQKRRLHTQRFLFSFKNISLVADLA